MFGSEARASEMVMPAASVGTAESFKLALFCPLSGLSPT